MEIYIGDVKQQIMVNSLNVEDEVDARSTADFNVRDLNDEKDFRQGDPVRIEVDGGVRWRGYIDQAEKYPITNKGQFIWHITCKDMHYLADKRIVGFSAKDTTAGDIVKEIIENYLVDEGVELDFERVKDGATISKFQANFVPASQVIDTLAEQSNFWWKIDKNFVMNFRKERDPLAEDYFFLQGAPYPAESEVSVPIWEKDIIGKPDVKTGNPLYRNVQWIKGTAGITDEQTETIVAFQEQESFVVGYEIIEEPTVELDTGGGFTAQTVGRKGESGYQFYWERNSPVITIDRDETPLSTNDEVRVTYVGRYNSITMVRDTDAIDAQHAREGNTGRVEDVINRDIQGVTEAIDFAQNKLNKYKEHSTQIHFVTRKHLEAGAIHPFFLPSLDIDEELLITKVTMFDRDGHLFYDVEAVRGPKFETWTDLFVDLQRRADTTIREGISGDDVLVIPHNYSKDWEDAEKPNIFRVIYPDAALYPAADLYPSFRTQDRVIWIEFIANDSPVFRKNYASRDPSDGDANEIVTTHFITAPDYSGDIDSIKWYGGFRATEEYGTGVEIDEEVFTDGDKTELEAFQIVRTDTKVGTY